MALFDENATVTPTAPSSRARGAQVGAWALTAALILLLVLSFIPSAYVIQRPGPVFDTLGSTADSTGEQVPMISVDGARTYPTDGSLDMLTVQVVGSRERTPTWPELAAAWFDPSRAVVPIDAVFPQGQTTHERDRQSAEMMVDSQKEATAVALTHLGYDVHPKLTVHSVMDQAAATGILKAGDVITEAEGSPIRDVDALRSAVADRDGAPVHLRILRDESPMTVSVTPHEQNVDGETTWLLGVTLITDYDFPIDVSIRLNDVGGPSAGMMFTLGIIDTLTPQSLTGGERFAGTGTIDASGQVGPIGGIRQKMFGASRAGARYFLAPDANCPEVVGHVPGHLQVFSVDTLDDALTVLETVREGGDLSELPTCTAG